MRNKPGIICVTPEQLAERLTHRPPEYLSDLEPCITSRSDTAVCMDTGHQAYVAAMKKYRGGTAAKKPVVTVENGTLLALSRHPEMVAAFPALSRLVGAPAGCLSCMSAASAAWRPLFDEVRRELAEAGETSLSALKTAMNTDKLRVLYRPGPGTDGKKQKVRVVIL